MVGGIARGIFMSDACINDVWRMLARTDSFVSHKNTHACQRPTKIYEWILACCSISQLVLSGAETIKNFENAFGWSESNRLDGKPARFVHGKVLSNAIIMLLHNYPYVLFFS